MFNELFNGAGLWFSVGIGVIILLILFLLIYQLWYRKKSNKKEDRDRETVRRLVRSSVLNSDGLDFVFANLTESQENRHGKKEYTYKNYIFAFREGEGYAIPVEFKNGRAYTSEAIALNPSTVGSVQVRYMKTNARFYDKSGGLLVEFTVAALNTSQIAGNCPFDIDQVDDASKYYTFIDRFCALINKQNEV